MGTGFRIEMDDFGTGYSSLSMLSNLPIDTLKLDMSFIHSAFGENRDVRMIELIIDIAAYLKVPVVAEGVETEEQYLGVTAVANRRDARRDAKARVAARAEGRPFALPAFVVQ